MVKSSRRTPRKTFPVLLPCVFLALLLFSPLLHAGPTKPAPETRIPTVRLQGISYLPVNALAEALDGRLRLHPIKKKLELRLAGNSLVFTLLSSVVVLNDVARRMPVEVRLHNGQYHAPADAVLRLLATLSPGSPRLLAGPPESTPEPVSYVVSEPTSAPIVEPEPEPLVQPQPAPQPDPARWALDTIIIDAGHGGKDPGAIGHRGTYEKDVVLPVAKRLKDLLEKRLNVRVVLTRTDDTFIPLARRAQIAVQNQGKLFISLHCNSAETSRPSGMEVYFLSEAKTAAAAEVARRENAVLELEKNGEENAPNDLDAALKSIQFALLSTQFLKESQDLASAVRTDISQTVIPLEDRGVKQANFYVMRGTMGAMPSILVELGFISNPAEEKRLKSTVFQKNLAEAIYRGIHNFKRRYDVQLTRTP